MLRLITYRHALTALIFAALWFVLGLVLLFSGIPGNLGIGREMFTAWLLLWFAISAIAGGALTMAAINGIWPPVERPPSHGHRAPVAPPTHTTASPDAHADGGRPLPWSASPLPGRTTGRARRGG